MAYRTLAAVVFAALLGIGAVVTVTPAKADCRTTCNQYGNQQVCSTHCW